MNNYKNMRLLLGFSMVFVLIFSQASSVAAANNQGLEWGVAVDDRLDYDVKISYHNTTLDLEIDDAMYVIINVTPSISDDITSISQILSLHMIFGYYTTYWDNGSIMNGLWNNILKMTPLLVLPIGNWPLVTQLLEDATPSAIITQDSSILNFTVENLPNPDNIQSTVLLKSDGATSSYLYNVTWGSETQVFVELTRQITTTSSTGPPIDYTLLAIGGAAVVAVVLILIIVRRR